MTDWESNHKWGESTLSGLYAMFNRGELTTTEYDSTVSWVVGEYGSLEFLSTRELSEQYGLER